MKLSNYNDGYIRIYKEKELKTDFYAKKNVKTLNDLEFIIKLAYEECSKRQQDLEFAQSNGSSLNIKLKTRLYKNIENDYKVTIQNTLYDIVYIDIDRKKEEMYFYLEEVRKIA